LRALRFHELARYPLCVAVAPRHRLARRREVSLEDTVDESLIVYSQAEYPEYHQSLEKLFTQVRKAPLIAEEQESVTSLIAAVEAGRGIALVPSCLKCLAGPRLKILPLTPAREEVIVGAVCRKEGASLAAAKFIEAAVG
jgi:DNA-binding transcriptional LysR family regulator